MSRRLTHFSEIEPCDRKAVKQKRTHVHFKHPLVPGAGARHHVAWGMQLPYPKAWAYEQACPMGASNADSTLYVCIAGQGLRQSESGTEPSPGISPHLAFLTKFLNGAFSCEMFPSCHFRLNFSYGISPCFLANMEGTQVRSVA